MFIFGRGDFESPICAYIGCAQDVFPISSSRSYRVSLVTKCIAGSELLARAEFQYGTAASIPCQGALG